MTVHSGSAGSSFSPTSAMSHHPEKPHDPFKNSRSMDKLRETALKLANSNPKKPLTPSQIALIENGLLRTFSSLKTPTHAAYAAMIEHAIEKLDEEDSSTTEEKISEFIQKKFEDLPWAHKRYLRHHLDKLCESGELTYGFDRCYVLRGRPKLKSPRRKLQRNSPSKLKEDVDEGNLAQDELTELTDVQVCFHEESSQGFGRGKRKRRRIYIVDEDDDDVVETMAVVKEGNMDSYSEMVVAEIRNEELLLKGGEVDCKRDELGQLTAVEDCELLDVSVGTSEPQIDIVCCSKEKVKHWEPQVDHDLCEARGEPELSGVPSTVMLPVECEDELMQVDDSSGANMMLVPVESVMESASVRDHHHSCSGDILLALGAVDGLKERGPNPRASELMIVPYVENAVKSALGKRIIVCCLPSEKPNQPKKRPRVWRHRKSLKLHEEKLKALREDPKLPSLVSPCKEVLK